MKNATTVKMQALVLVVMLAVCTPATLAQKGKPAGGAKSQAAGAGAEAAPKSPCGSQTQCYDTADFTATITQFRTSTDGSGNKILDAMVHFQNKTDQVLSLGYVDGSAESLDDHGNRYELNKERGIRGMGVVAGTTPDAKFVLQPNGTGDARFELMSNPKDRIVGATYELELSVREMNRGDDKQWALGNETLLHYDGLANGSGATSASAAHSGGSSGGTASPSADAATDSSDSAAAPSGAAHALSVGSAFASNAANGAASQPCGTATAKVAGAANSTGQNGAADAVSSTTAAITSISSLFGHKKTAPAPAAATKVASASPCAAATNVDSGGGSTAAPKANPVAQPAATTSAAAAPAATPRAAPAGPAPAPSRAVTKPVPARQTGVVNALMKQPVAPTNSPKAPAPATSAAKTPAAVPAAKKPTPVTAPATATSGAK